jgi:hypothetical protein
VDLAWVRASAIGLASPITSCFFAPTLNPRIDTLAMSICEPNEIKLSRTAESFPYHAEIAKPSGHLDHIIDWCKAECRDTWRWRLIDTSDNHRPGRYMFYFDSDRDACAFTLKWL